MKATIFTVGAVLLGATFATSARAQEAKVTGAVPASSTSSTPIAAKVEDDSPDHERFIGHFAVGYMGISQIPIGNEGAGANGLGLVAGSVTAPIIGVRYWFQRNLGVDAGVGFGYTTSSTTTVTGNVTTNVDNPSQLGFALHGGLPIAFAEGHHYTFELVPEATLGFANGTIKAPPAGPGGVQAPDISENGFRIDVGARIGAEIHFGFMGIPELALEASVGLYVRHQQYSLSQGNNSASAQSTSVATSVENEPWAIFANSLSALYYF